MGTIQPYSLNRWSSSWQKDGVPMKAGLQVKALLLNRELGCQLEEMQLYCKPVDLKTWA